MFLRRRRPANDNQSDTPEVGATPEVGDANQGQNEPTEIPEATEIESHGEVTGTITAIDVSTITVESVTYNLTDFSEVKGTPQVGELGEAGIRNKSRWDAFSSWRSKPVTRWE